MSEKNVKAGLLGVFGIWLTAGLALPFVKYLKPFATAEQLMMARGVVTAAIAFLCIVVLRQRFRGVERNTILSGVFFGLACLGLFKGIQTWGVNPTIIVVTATPVFNFLLAWKRKKEVPVVCLIGLCAILLGVIIAFKPWDWKSELGAWGFFWSAFGAVMNAAFYEYVSRKTDDSRLKRCFWQAGSVAVIGLVVAMFAARDANWSSILTNHKLQLMVFGLALVHGFLYFLANITAFDERYLDKVVASVLAQGEVPAVIAMSYFLVNETMSALQWAGVFIALYGAWYLSNWVAKQDSKKEMEAS